MSDEEKQAECERICGEAGKDGMHRLAPEMCPIQQDRWLGTYMAKKKLVICTAT